MPLISDTTPTGTPNMVSTPTTTETAAIRNFRLFSFSSIFICRLNKQYAIVVHDHVGIAVFIH